MEWLAWAEVFALVGFRGNLVCFLQSCYAFITVMQTEFSICRAWLFRGIKRCYVEFQILQIAAKINILRECLIIKFVRI